jgi:hypothetical protein
VSCVPPGWHAMDETESSWSSGVHDADLHGRSRIVWMSKWLTVLLRGSCESWHEGRHGDELHGLYVAPVLLCIQLPSLVYVAKIQANLSLWRWSPENSMSIVLVLPLAKSVGVCV